MDTCFYSSRIQLELMHNSNFSSHPAPSGGEPDAKKPKVPRKPNKVRDDEKEKQSLAKYTVKGEEVLRPYSETGYIDGHGGGGIPTQILTAGKPSGRKKNAARATKVGRTKAMEKARRQTVRRLSKHLNQRYKNFRRPIL